MDNRGGKTSIDQARCACTMIASGTDMIYRAASSLIEGFEESIHGKKRED